MHQYETGNREMIPAQISKRNKTVMIVDDDVDQREYLTVILQSNGLQVISFENAHKALSAIRDKTSIDIVITDLQMPHMNGLQFVEALRKILPGIPVIVLTGHASVETYFKSFGLGVLEYINKPIDESEVIRIVKLVINKANERARYRMSKKI